MDVLLNKLITIRSLLIAMLVITALLAGCATSSNSKTGDASSIPVELTPPSFDPVTFEHEMGPVGDTIRAFTAEAGGGVVLMSGLEERAMAAVKFRQTPYQDAITEMANAINCGYIHTADYYMILPEEYQALQRIHVADQLDESFKALTASAVFGSKTHLYNVFSVLSESLGIAIVADNFIADARCGEIFLEQVSLPVILEAVLQSARIGPDSFTVESTKEYIFIRATKNVGLAERLLNPSEITPKQRGLLDKQISLILPDDSVAVQAAFTAEPLLLRDVLATLSRQLGISILAQRELADVPINPCRLHKVRLETALNLLLRQWPLPDFGFEVQEEKILIRQD